MIRDDQDYLEQMLKAHGHEFAKEFIESPILVLSQAQCDEMASKIYDYSMSDFSVKPTEIYFGDDDGLPFDQFVFLFKNVGFEIVETKEQARYDLYGLLKKDNEQGILSIMFYLKHDGFFIVDAILDKDAGGVYVEISGCDQTGKLYVGKKMGSEFYKKHETTIHAFINVFKFVLQYLHDCDSYPVQVTRERPPKIKGRKNQWKRQLGPRVIYLDHMPTHRPKDLGKKVSSGATKRGHQRRGHYKTLRHEKFKRHPRYMIPNGVYVKPAWVGPEEVSYQGNVYKLRRL